MKAPTWHSETLPEVKTPSPAGWLRLVLRVLVLLTVIGVGLVVLGLLRLVERPVWGAHRPITPYVTQAVCRVGLIILGLRLKVSGRPMARAGALVSNHISWIDVFAINATTRVCFVAKSEVAGWPGIGLLARVTGTAFVKREAAEAGTQRDLLRQRIRDGFLLAFFPEGTTTDGLQVLPFKSALFAAFTDMPALRGAPRGGRAALWLVGRYGAGGALQDRAVAIGPWFGDPDLSSPAGARFA